MQLAKREASFLVVTKAATARCISLFQVSGRCDEALSLCVQTRQQCMAKTNPENARIQLIEVRASVTCIRHWDIGVYWGWHVIGVGRCYAIGRGWLAIGSRLLLFVTCLIKNVFICDMYARTVRFCRIHTLIALNRECLLSTVPLPCAIHTNCSGTAIVTNHSQ